MEEHGSGLHFAQSLIAQLALNTCAVSHVSIAGAVYNDLGADALNAPLGSHNDAGDGAVFHNRLQEIGVIQDFNTCLGQHIVCHQLQAFCFEGGAVVMSNDDPGNKTGAGSALAGMDGVAPGYQLIDDLAEHTANHLLLTFLVVAGHERTNQTLGSHTAGAVALFYHDNTNTLTSCCNGSAHAAGAAADHDNVSAELAGEICEIHIKILRK